MNPIEHETYVRYPVWDRTTRIFHWVNVLCVIALIAVGLIILNAKAFEVGKEGKILLKTVHVYIGYVFCVNLLWRIVWGFAGNRFARWRAVLPIGRDYRRSLGEYLRSLRAGRPQVWLGHNPLARLMVALLFLLLSFQAVTGLTLAGTDLYVGPFGHEIAEWVTRSGEDHSKLEGLKPGSMEQVDPEAYAEMREFRKPFITVHQYSFYVLALAIILHIVAVVVTEIRERSGLVSAMFTGHKMIAGEPVDDDKR